MHKMLAEIERKLMKLGIEGEDAVEMVDSLISKYLALKQTIIKEGIEGMERALRLSNEN